MAKLDLIKEEFKGLNMDLLEHYSKEQLVNIIKRIYKIIKS